MVGEIRQRRSIRGFTIVELLIVIVVIAILAAITIVAYNGIQNRAKNSAVQNAAAQAEKKLLSYAVTNADLFPDTLDDPALGLNGGSVTYQYSHGADRKDFCLTVTQNNVSYYVSNTNNSPVGGACAGHGANGTPVTTNLLLNPSWELSVPLNASTSNTGTSTADVTSSTDWSNNGTRSLKVAIPSSSTSSDTAATIAGSVSQLSGAGVTFVPGKTYTVSATIYLPATQSNANTRARSIYYANSVSGWQSSMPYVTAAPNATGAYQLSATFTVPPSATWCIVRLYNGAAAPNGPVYWDSVMITESDSTIPYKDGSSSGWVWNGTANSSTSSGPIN